MLEQLKNKLYVNEVSLGEQNCNLKSQVMLTVFPEPPDGQFRNGMRNHKLHLSDVEPGRSAEWTGCSYI